MTYKSWLREFSAPAKRAKQALRSVEQFATVRYSTKDLLEKVPAGRKESDAVAVIVPGKFGLAVKAKSLRAMLKVLGGDVELQISDKALVILHSHNGTRFTGKATFLPYFQNATQLQGTVKL